MVVRIFVSHCLPEFRHPLNPCEGSLDIKVEMLEARVKEISRPEGRLEGNEQLLVLEVKVDLRYRLPSRSDEISGVLCWRV